MPGAAAIKQEQAPKRKTTQKPVANTAIHAAWQQHALDMHVRSALPCAGSRRYACPDLFLLLLDLFL
jgi:hypothetical protein